MEKLPYIWDLLYDIKSESELAREYRDTKSQAKHMEDIAKAEGVDLNALVEKHFGGFGWNEEPNDDDSE